MYMQMPEAGFQVVYHVGSCSRSSASRQLPVHARVVAHCVYFYLYIPFRKVCAA